MPAALLVGLLGGECTGKSTLAAAVAARTGALVVPEALRAFVEERGRPPAREEQGGILDAQAAACRAALDAAEAAGIGLVVADPHPAMTAAYHRAYFADRSLDAAAVAGLRTAGLLAWCQPDVPWVPDGIQRDGPAMREAAHDEVGALLALAGAEAVALAGPLEARVARLLDAIAALGS